MYFIAKILQLKSYVIIPKTWVREIEKEWEIFVNNGLNKNKKFDCFHSSDQHVFDDEGRPNDKFIPDWPNLLALDAISCANPTIRSYQGNLLY